MAHTPLIAPRVQPTPTTQPTRTPRATITVTAAQHRSRHSAATGQPRTSALRGTARRPVVAAVVVPSYRTEPSLPAADGGHTYAA